MDDKEIGELWQRAVSNQPWQVGKYFIIPFILQLVEERARALYAEYNISQQDVYEVRWEEQVGMVTEPFRVEARQQFGIDEKTWIR